MTPLELKIEDLKQRVELLEAQNSANTGFVPALNKMAVNIHDMVKQQNIDLLQQIDQQLEDKWNSYLQTIQESVVSTEITLDSFIKIVLCNDQVPQEELNGLKEQVAKFLQRNSVQGQVQ